MRKFVTRLVFGIIGACILASALFLVWSLYIPSPMPEAISALSSTGNVEITTGDLLIFVPTGKKATTGFIFYPGARVDHRAYSPSMQAIAERGFLVVVPKMPLNMALFAPGRAAVVQGLYPDISRWVVGGHSMGGVFAAQFASLHQDSVKGLVLWASYRPDSGNIRSSTIKVLSIYGSNDGVATPDEVLGGRSLLPDDASFFEIKGGNHAQFGWYGDQSGDSMPGITREEQQRQTVEETVRFLHSIESR